MSIHGFCRLFVIGMVIIALTGCQATRRGLNFDTSATLNIHVDPQVNPDLDDRPSPIMLRVFKLADARQFENEDFLNLYENPVERLGDDLLGMLALRELVPGEQRVEHLTLTEDVRYLGLMAEYMQHGRANAMLLLPVEAYRRNTINLQLRYLSLVDMDNPDSVRNSRLSHRDQYRARDRAAEPASRKLPGYRDAQQTVDQVREERDFWRRTTAE